MLRHLIKLSSRNSYNYNVFHGIKNLSSKKLHLTKEDYQAMQNEHLFKSNEISKYHKQKEKILDMINNYNLDEILRYEISKGRANKLLAWRTRNGFLKNLNDIFFIEGFGLKVVDKFFQSLLVEPKAIELNLGKGQVRTASFVAPSMEAEQRQAIKSSVSVRIGVNSITWSCLDVPGQDINAPCLLTHWQHREISEKKLHINELIQRCLHVHQLIPAADCYLFENPQMASPSTNPGSVEQQNVNIQKAQVTAIMGYALASRNSQFNDVAENQSDKKSNYLPNVFYIRRLLSARLFNHLVGTESVSSEQSVLNMMRTFYNTNELSPLQQDPTGSDDLQQLSRHNAKISGCVQFPMELREMFSKAPRYYREFLSQTLLLNLAFIRLVLLQDTESIAIVSRGKKAKTSLNNQA